MINCKFEFLTETLNRDILCAEITKDREVFRLPIMFSRDQFNGFLEKIDFEYDDIYSEQEIYGFIWYKDGTWSERCSYNGGAWWVYKSTPNIPDYLKSE